MRSFDLVLALGFSVMIGACALMSPASLEDQNVSVSQIKNAVVSVAGDIRKLEGGGRIIYTTYFDRSRKILLFNEKPGVRYFSIVRVIGDRRPYDIDVEVVRETLVRGTYVETGSDEEIATAFSQDLAEKLKIEKTGKSVVDDFKAF